MGTPQVAAAALRRLVAAGHEVVVVVTRPDTRRGRGPLVGPSPVKEAAVALGLPVAHRAAGIVGSGAELGVVVAYGRMITPDVLAQVPMVNVHFSLLPRWRGAAPVERAILAGDDRTGVCLMQLEAGLDTGPVLARREVVVGPEETADELRRRLGGLGEELLVETLADGLPAPVPQAGAPTYAEKLSAGDRRLDFGQPARACHRVVRVGRAWTTWRGKRLLVHRARLAPEGLGLSPGQIQGNVVGTREGALELTV
ncbi:MAG: methionyl-tRNA formyltransferase, partial [Acidimicrobiales bacterium]